MNRGVRAAGVTLVAVSLLGISACGGTPGTADGKKGVRQVTEAWLQAVADAKGKDACKLMTSEFREEATGLSSCAQGIKRVASSISEPVKEKMRGYEIPENTIKIIEESEKDENRTEAKKDAEVDLSKVSSDDSGPIEKEFDVERVGERWLVDG